MKTYCRFLAASGLPLARLPRTDDRQVSRLADRHTLKPSHPCASQRTSDSDIISGHSPFTVTRSYRIFTCFPFHRIDPRADAEISDTCCLLLDCSKNTETFTAIITKKPEGVKWFPRKNGETGIAFSAGMMYNEADTEKRTVRRRSWNTRKRDWGC